ncbi:MAG: NnrS family protein [Parvibaculum sp.]|uniref:NnrS family protein n=1 Tax=Parvibaculum sp. TaxID=2024848 RepID=UPI0032EEEC13
MKAASGGIPRYRKWKGPAILEQGFRPFFLLAGLHAALALALWIHVLAGGWTPPMHFPLLSWHAHEMIHGFAMAAVAGFMLTAIPNWTGRMPLQGLPLLVLVLLWGAGRIVMPFSALTGAGVAAAVDLAFPLVFLAVVAREIVAGRNWRNLPMTGALTLLLASNALMHAEAAGAAIPPGTGARLGLGLLVLLISLVGGRIVPSFTRNWLAKRGETKLPASFGWTDRIALGATAAAIAVFVVAPESALLAWIALAAALAQAARLVRWRGAATGAEPLVAILHLGYAFIPLGLALLGFSILTSAVPQAAALHAFGAGAVGTMILAVMTRATLGHTGRALRADRATVALYAAIILAALTRIAAAFLPGMTMTLLVLSGALWFAGFLGFALVYGRYLARPRAKA